VVGAVAVAAKIDVPTLRNAMIAHTVLTNF